MGFSFGTVFSRFFKLIGENFALFAFLGLIFTILPALAVNYGLYTYFGVTQTTWTAQFSNLGVNSYYFIAAGVLLLAVLNLLNLSIVTEVAILRAVDKKPQVGSVVGHAFANILPLFVVGIAKGLLVGLGFILLIVPGIIWMICTCVAIPAYVGETNIGIGGALSRSFELTRNHRWTIFAVGVVLFLVAGAIGGAYTGIFMAYNLPNPTAHMAASGLPMAGLTPVVITQMIQILISGVESVIGNIFIVAIYVCLRESKDKATPSQAAAVFE